MILDFFTARAFVTHVTLLRDTSGHALQLLFPRRWPLPILLAFLSYSTVAPLSMIRVSRCCFRGYIVPAFGRFRGALRLEKWCKSLVTSYNPVRDGFSVSSELNELADQLMAKGVTAMSYHVTPPFYSQVSKRTSVFHFGYPEEIVSTYLDPAILESDPIPDHVMAVGHVMTWQQSVADQKLTENHRNFVKKAMDLGFVDGIAVPLFGPNSRNSYFSMNFGRHMSTDDESLVRPLVSIAQSCHRRVCAIINMSSKDEPPLSERESQVLYWISRGKSNADMAIILDISDATVDSYIRRLFKKLQVHDRISAVIVGLSNSLIKLM